MLTVLLGGARSGKSSTAVRLAADDGRPVTYVATSPHIDGDTDLEHRIAVHRRERPPEWNTIEEEIDLAAAVDACGSALVVVDCLTVWIGNLLHDGHGDGEIDERSNAALMAVGRRSAPTIVISNEVGLGIVPDNALARRYRDLLGRVNQSWVAASDRALLMVAGRALPLVDPGSET